MAEMKTFRAKTMSAALAAVKQALGPDAVILGTRSVPARVINGLTGRDEVEITAASGDTPSNAPRAKAPAGTATATPRKAVAGERAVRAVDWPTISSRVPEYAEVERIDRLVAAAESRQAAETPARRSPPERSVVAPAREHPPAPAAGPRELLAKQVEPFYLQLVQQDVSKALAKRLVSEAIRRLPRGQQFGSDEVADSLRRYIAELVPTSGGVQLESGACKRVAFVGPAGGGKTTTLAKLAAHFKLRQKKRVALLSVDTQRIGAQSQLERYGELIGVPVYTVQSAMEVKNAVHQIGEVDLVLIDTPGAGLREQSRFARLAMLLRAARVSEVHLVLPASLAAGTQRSLVRAFEPLGAKHLIWTHLDDAVGLGVLLETLDQVALQVSYLASGQRVPNDIKTACGREVAALILSDKG